MSQTEITTGSLTGKRVLLIVSGGIAAFKALELIRLLRKQGCAVRCVLTRNGAEFVTALSLQALSESKVYTDLFSLTDESEMGHIQLSRSADLVVVETDGTFAQVDSLKSAFHGAAATGLDPADLTASVTGAPSASAPFTFDTTSSIGGPLAGTSSQPTS